MTDSFGEWHMQTAESVVNGIVDLDARAEGIRAKARGEAEAILREARGQAERDRAANEVKIAERIAAIEASAAKSREEETARVKKEFAGNVEAVKSVDAAVVGKVVDMVIARMKGAAR